MVQPDVHVSCARIYLRRNFYVFKYFPRRRKSHFNAAWGKTGGNLMWRIVKCRLSSAEIASKSRANLTAQRPPLPHIAPCEPSGLKNSAAKLSAPSAVCSAYESFGRAARRQTARGTARERQPPTLQVGLPPNDCRKP